MATIELLPDRLNREPTVYRGLTTSELLLAVLSGLIAGLIAGSVLAILAGSWPVIPTAMLLSAAFSVQAGGRWLARLRRGRPDCWLYQMLAAQLARYGLGEQRLVQHSAVWVIRRSLK